MALDKGVRDYIAQNQHRFVSEVVKLVSQPSVSAREEGLEECATLVKSMIEEVGGKARLLTIHGAPPLVYGEIPSRRSDKTILFYNHYDVQPEEPLDLWKSPPFKPEVRDGRLYGRGSSDDKGEIVARLKLIEAYVKTQGEPPCNVKFCIEGEEEIGSGHLERYVEENKSLFKADAVVWEDGMIDDGRPSVGLGVKGMVYLELKLRDINRDAHSKYAAALPSAAWRLMRLLRTIRDDDHVISIPGWYDDIKPLTADEIALADKQPSEAEKLRQAYGTEFIGNLTVDEAKQRLISGPTANIAGIWSGYTGPGSKTVLPAESHCRIDFRIVPDQDPDKLYSLFMKHLEENGFTDVEVKKLWMEPASRTDYRDPWAQAAINAGRDVFGKEPTIELSSPGTGPGYVFTRGYGMPLVMMGVSPSDAGMHAPNENLRLDYLEKGMVWIGQTIENFLGKGSP